MTKEDAGFLLFVMIVAALWAWLPYVNRFKDRYLFRRRWAAFQARLPGWRLFLDGGATWSQGWVEPEKPLLVREASSSRWVLKGREQGVDILTRVRMEKLLDPNRPRTHTLWRMVGEALCRDSTGKIELFGKPLDWRSLPKEVHYPESHVLIEYFSWVRQISRLPTSAKSL